MRNKIILSFMLLFFFIGALGFWYVTGYQVNFDAEKLRAMAVMRVGFSLCTGTVSTLIPLAIDMILD